MKTLFRVFSLLFVFVIFLSGCSQLQRIMGEDPEEKLEGVERIIITPRRGGTEVDVSVEYRENMDADLAVEVLNPAPMAVAVDGSMIGTRNHAQALVPMMGISFTAKNRTTIYGLRFKMAGLSQETDVSNIYLYETGEIGDNEIAEFASFDDKYVEFRNPDGLFNVSAGATMNVVLRVDISGTTTSGKTIRFDIESTDDIDAGAIQATASFPLKGSTASVVSVNDLGSMIFANVSPTGSTTAPSGFRYYYGWRFSLVASDQDMELRFLKITNTGTASPSDIGNFRLMYLNEVVARAEMTDNGEIVFVLVENPHIVPQGQAHNLDLVFDIAQGATGTFHFMIKKMNHIVVFDRRYEVFTTPNQDDIWTVIQSNTASTSTVIEGTPESEIPGQGIFVGELKLSLASDSPSGNVACGAANVAVARFNAFAIGEDIILNSLNVQSNNVSLNDGRIYIDGAQIGSTADIGLKNSYTTFNFKTSLVIKEDEIKVIEIRADVKYSDGVSLTDGEPFNVVLVLGSANARGLQSGMAISTDHISGNTLTARTGTLWTLENTGLADANAANPSGVVGETHVLIGSVIITAGSGEGSEIHQITLRDNFWKDDGITIADVFQNLRLESGGPADANGNYHFGAQIGSTIGSLVDAGGTIYRFTTSPAIELSASAQIVVNIYADIRNSVSENAITAVNESQTGVIYVSEVSAIGTQTGVNTGDSDGTNSGLQRVYIAQKGELLVEAVPYSSQARTRILVAGTEDVELFKFKVSAKNEDADITRFIISQSIESEEWGAMNLNGSPFSALKNYKLWDGDRQIGPILSSLTWITRDIPMSGYADFNFGTMNAYRIPKGEEHILIVTATVNNWPSISSGSVYQMYLCPDPLNDGTPAITARGAGSANLLSGPDQEIWGNPITVRRSVPLVERLSLPATNLSSSGTHTIAKFKITSVGHDTRHKKWTFYVAWTDCTPSIELAISNLKLYRNGMLLGQSEYTIYDGLGTEPEHILSAGGNAVLKVSKYGGGNTAAVNAALVFGDASLVDMTGEEIIAQGSSNTYELKADILNAHQGASTDADNISITMLGDDNYDLPWTGTLQTHSGGVVTVRPDESSNFIWSDYSASTGDHSSSIPMLLHITSADRWTQDWTDGLWVPSIPSGNSFLPLDSWNLSK